MFRTQFFNTRHTLTHVIRSTRGQGQGLGGGSLVSVRLCLHSLQLLYKSLLPYFQHQLKTEPQLDKVAACAVLRLFGLVLEGPVGASLRSHNTNANIMRQVGSTPGSNSILKCILDKQIEILYPEFFNSFVQQSFVTTRLR